MVEASESLRTHFHTQAGPEPGNAWIRARGGKRIRFNGTGDAAVVMMADESDDCRDVVRYCKLLNQGLKLRLNRLTNAFIMLMFGIKLNNTTNSFKAYRATVIQGCLPLLSPHFNLTVELPLKTIVRVEVFQPRRLQKTVNNKRWSNRTPAAKRPSVPLAAEQSAKSLGP